MSLLTLLRHEGGGVGPPTEDLDMDLYATLTIAAKAKFTNDTFVNSTVNQDIDLAKRYTFKAGTAVGQADKLFYNRYTLAGAGVQNLDLAGALVDFQGQTITMAKIRGIVVAADDGNGVNTITLTRPASNGAPLFLAAGDGIDLQAGDSQGWVSKTGRAVVAGTGDLLTLTNGGAAQAIVEVFILGTSV